jgi:hypothetical protein
MGGKVVVASQAGIAIRALSDIPDFLGAVVGAEGLILTEPDLGPAFFDLRSGLAGEVLQKCTNYRVKTALVMPDPAAYGQRFSELAYEHASHNLIRFVRTEAEARAWLGME